MPQSISLYLAISALLSTSLAAPANEGTALTGRYYDCCKPSCAWPNKAAFSNPIRSCDIDDRPLTDFNVGTGCNTGGKAYACSDQSPWAVNDTFSYGFVGAFLKGGEERDWCGSCFELHFTSGPGNLTSKRMIVQTSNTDYDVLNDNMFTFAIPGGNNSYGACPQQWDLSSSAFGTGNTGVSERSQCDSLPEAQRRGCYWRFDWFLDASEPNVHYTRVQCPSELTDITGTIRQDDTSFSLNSTSTGASNPSSKPPSAFGLLGSIATVAVISSWILA